MPIPIRVAGSIACCAWSAQALGAGAGADRILASERLGEVLLGLVAVLGAIVAAAWLGRRLLRLHPGMDSRLRLVGGLSLGPRERIVLVQAGDTQLLVGVAPGRVQTLHVLDAPLELAPAPDPPPRGAPFARVLERLQGRGAGERSS